MRFLIESSNAPRALLGALALALVARLTLALLAPYAVSPDGVTNLEMARAIRDGRFADLSYFHPLYPTLIALLSPSKGTHEVAGRFLSLLFAVLTLFPLHSLARALADEAVAWRTVLIAALWPIHALHSVEVLNMAVYVFFVVAFLDSGWRSLRADADSNPRGLTASSLYLIAAYWTRPEAIGLWLLFLGAVSLTAFRRPHTGRFLARLRWPAVVAAIFLAGILPYALFLRWQTGVWTPSRYLTNITAHTSAQPERMLPHRIHNETVSTGYLLNGILNHAGGIATKYAVNLGRLILRWTPELFPVRVLAPVWLLIVAVGWLWFFSRGKRREWAWLAATTFASMSVVALHGGTSRYLLPILPALLIWLAAGLRRMEEGFLSKWTRIPTLTVTACAIAGPFAIEPILREGLGARAYFPVELKLAGLELREAHSQIKTVLARKPQVGFYAGIPTAAPSMWTPDGIRAAFPEGATDVALAVDERDTLELFPDLAIFLHDPPPQGWRILIERREPPAIRILTPVPPADSNDEGDR